MTKLIDSGILLHLFDLYLKYKVGMRTKFLLADKNYSVNGSLKIFGLIGCYERDKELCHFDHSEIVCSD